MEEIKKAQAEIDAVELPEELVLRIKYLLASLNYCQHLGGQSDLNSKSKTSLQYAKDPLSKLCTDKNCGMKHTGICWETENMLSVRAQQTMSTMLSTFIWWLAIQDGHEERKKTIGRELFPFIASHRLNPAKIVEPHFQNDRLLWTKNLWVRANDDFDMVNSEQNNIIFDFARFVASLEAKEKRTASDIAAMYNKLMKMRSVAKYPMMIKLEDLAGRTD